MKRLLCIIPILTCCLMMTSKVSADTETKLSLLIGTPQNRAPYIHTNEKHQLDGILVKPLRALCKHINYDCVFIQGSFHPNLERLQNGGLQVLLVLDDAILPEVDQVSLSEPLCKINPVFIQVNTLGSDTKKQPAEFEGKKLGVLSGSTLHLDLVDNYYEFASIRPYDFLESAAFDLAFGRIDSLYASEAFYLDRVEAKSLMSEIPPYQKMGATSTKQPAKFPTGMRLAIPDNETLLLEKFNNAISEKKMGQDCADLIQRKRKTSSLIITNDLK